MSTSREHGSTRSHGWRNHCLATYLATGTDGVLTLELAGINTYVGGQRTDGLAYIEGLTITPRQALPLQFDFGAGMPVASGYDEVDKDTGYNSSLGYGFTSLTGNVGTATFGLAQQRWSEQRLYLRHHHDLPGHFPTAITT